MVAKDVGYGVVHAGLLPGKQVAAWGRVEPLVQIYNFRAHETAAATPAFTDNYIWMLHDGTHAVVVDLGMQPRCSTHCSR